MAQRHICYNCIILMNKIYLLEYEKPYLIIDRVILCINFYAKVKKGLNCILKTFKTFAPVEFGVP